MKLRLLAALVFAAGIFTACESDNGSTHSTTTVYYGAAFYDPWYHGDYDHDHDVVVTPPPANRPPIRPPEGGGGFAPRPEHPIARPPGDFERPGRPSTQPTPRPPSVSTRPAPSIPSAPRPAPRGGGGRR